MRGGGNSGAVISLIRNDIQELLRRFCQRDDLSMQTFRSVWTELNFSCLHFAFVEVWGGTRLGLRTFCHIVFDSFDSFIQSIYALILEELQYACHHAVYVRSIETEIMEGTGLKRRLEQEARSRTFSRQKRKRNRKPGQKRRRQPKKKKQTRITGKDIMNCTEEVMEGLCNRAGGTQRKLDVDTEGKLEGAAALLKPGEVSLSSLLSTLPPLLLLSHAVHKA